MAGLLDSMFQSPESQDGLLAFSSAMFNAGGPSRMPVSFGQALGQGMQAGQGSYQDAIKRKMLKQKMDQDALMQDMQLKQMQAQQDEAKRKREQEAQRQQMIDGMNPMQAGPVPQPQMDAYKLFSMGMLPGSEYLKTTQPQPRKLMSVAPGNTVLDEADPTKPVFTAPDRADKPDINAMIIKGPDGNPMLNPLYMQGRGQLAQLGATRVNQSVNTGQKGFDNTLKLRGDFRSEPVYKAHQEMQSAYSQIQQSLKQASPAGDLAGATKIMKLLDPGSVVRESELGMAMAASGLLDRAQNYASMIISGQKLTPTQRKDFQTLADRLYGESVKQYNAKRGEYKGIADRNALDVRDVLGDESSGPGGASSDPADPLGIRR